MTKPADPGYDAFVERVHRTFSTLFDALGREPTVADIAAELGEDDGEVQEALARTPTSGEDYSGRPVGGRSEG